MRDGFIQAEKAQYPVEVLCRVMAVARSGFYAWCQRPLSRRAQENQAVLAQIRHSHQESDGRYGGVRAFTGIFVPRDSPGSVGIEWRG